MTTKGCFKNQFADFAPDVEKEDTLLNASKDGVLIIFYYLIYSVIILNNRIRVEKLCLSYVHAIILVLRYSCLLSLLLAFSCYYVFIKSYNSNKYPLKQNKKKVYHVYLFTVF